MGVTGLLLIGRIYAIALAMPFVPGVELGLLMIALFGTAGALGACLATIAGLVLSLSVGTLLPAGLTLGILERLRIDPTGGCIMPGARRNQGVSAARSGWSRRLGGLLLRHRYLAFAVSLNFPGNSAVGGGGGLALLCGMSGQFGWRAFAATAALATPPLPALVLAGLLDVQPLVQHNGVMHNLHSRIARLFIH